MPNFDHTGPEGLGPRTGMMFGKCRKTSANTEVSESQRPYCNGRRKKMKGDKVERLKFKK
ncbi:DUF5320 domain-containing protein [Formosa algae]|uniref:Uncharacterized protein n=1 Tax=Formosa algae TaxID=225843 RepID=A0A9X1C9B6_9FLAO|nr:DUF5320 domain-containing protein [Formosa algae]MBP1839898.1 hypothetical protein [Formosa algae]MDQ0335497.1 hypothetical protein [Formosa algae]OEI81797.1 hypothetical protein AST99_02640 [Formosa algae]